MLALPVLAVPSLPAPPLLWAGRRSLGCNASSSGVSSTTPLPFTLLTSGRSLGALRLELAQPTCSARALSVTAPCGHAGRSAQEGAALQMRVMQAWSWCLVWLGLTWQV